MKWLIWISFNGHLPRPTCQARAAVSLMFILYFATTGSPGAVSEESGSLPSHAIVVADEMFSAQTPGTSPEALGQDAPVDETQEAPSQNPSDAHDSSNTLDAIDLFDLSVPVVVTASRHEQKLTTVPYAVTVITAAQIRRAGATSVPDALRLAPGVDVSGLSMTMEAVAPRGLHGWLGNYTLVLVDGRQIYDSFFGGAVWTAWGFQVEDIERIEVVRGPGGVTWGANAVNGVINIITKDPADQHGVTLKLIGGSRGSHEEYFSYAFADDKLRFRISGSYDSSDGFRDGGSLLRSLSDYNWGGDLHLHAIFDATPSDSLLVSIGSHVGQGAPTSPLAGLRMQRNAGADSNYAIAKWVHTVESDNQLELTGYVNDFTASNGHSAVDYRYQQYALQLNHTFYPAPEHLLTWGIDGRVDVLDASNADPFLLTRDFVSNPVIGTYVQDEWRLSSRWTLTTGGRVDYDSYGGFQPSARQSLSYRVTDDMMIFGAVSRAYHMPVAASRFLDLPMLDGLARVTANRNIDPTSLVAYEIGYRGVLLKRCNASVNLFWHEYSDVTAFAMSLAPPRLLRVHYDNAADASLYGAEAELRYAVSPQLSLLGSYTYQQLDWRSELSVHNADRMTPPEHKFMVGASYEPIENLVLSGHLYWVDRVDAPNPANPFLPRNVGAYTRLDLRAEYEFWEDRAAFAISARNLLDRGHYEGGTMFLNDAEVPRMLFAELRLKFD